MLFHDGCQKLITFINNMKKLKKKKLFKECIGLHVLYVV